MNTLLIAALAVLAFPLCVVRDPDRLPDARNWAEYVAAVRQMKWWHPAWWLLGLFGGFAVALWFALRYALYLLSVVTARASAWTARATALDGRGLRVYRPTPYRPIGARP